jgi:hypothetical protein
MVLALRKGQWLQTGVFKFRPISALDAFERLA